MALPDAVADLGQKYEALFEQFAEFLIVAIVLYTLGRFAVQPGIHWVLERWRLQPTLRETVEKLLRAGIVVVAVVVAAWIAGYQALLGGSALIFAAMTLAIGFAAQDVLSNFVAGIFIVQDRNFNIDDWIEWDDKAGFISDIGFRVTRIKTFDNETVTVPNTVLATTPVTNRMSNDTLRISYTIDIEYDDSIETATEILIDVARGHDDILDDPEPSVRVDELGETSISLQSRFWIADPDRKEFSKTRSEYIAQITEAFRQADIDLSSTSQHDLSGDLTVHEPTAEA